MAMAESEFQINTYTVSLQKASSTRHHVLHYELAFRVIQGKEKGRILIFTFISKNPILKELGASQKGWEDFISKEGPNV